MSQDDEAPKKTIQPYDHLRVPVFEFDPGASVELTVRAAAFPARWLGVIQRQYETEDRRNKRFLPTWSLTELVAALDPNIAAVSSSLSAKTWIHATADVEREVLIAAVAAWAAAHITPDRPEIDWYTLLGEDPIEWRDVRCDLAVSGLHANGTAAPTSEMYTLLPMLLAKTVVARGGLKLRGSQRPAVLGPLEPGGHRMVVFWPPVAVANDDKGEGLWTPKVDFGVNLVPGYPRPRIHANLTATRFPLLPVGYVPDRGSHQSLTYWLHASSGFLRNPEQATLLAATAVRRQIDGQWRWVWNPGLSNALARLTDRPYPDAEAVASDPRAHTTGELTAHIMFAEGYRLTAPVDAELTDEQLAKRPATVDHPAEVGFLPDDHLHVYDQLADAFAGLGLRKIEKVARRKTPKQRKILKAADRPDSSYTLELWTETEVTRGALLIAIRDCFGLTETGHTKPDVADGHETLTYSGAFELTVHLREVGSLTAGIPMVTETKNGRTRRIQDPEYLDRLREQITAIGACGSPRGIVLELRGAKHFSRAKLGDPKRTLKLGMTAVDRNVQCVTPLREETSNPKRKTPPKLHPGTQFSTGTIKWATNTVADALRLAGRLPVIPPPRQMPKGCELIGLWLENADGCDIPMAMKISPDGIASVVLATADGTGTEQLPLAKLPKALAAGRGRLSRSRHDTGPLITRFLTTVLDLEARHDRIVYVRAGSYRSRWRWLQDQHLAVNQLVLPGEDPAADTTQAHKPGDYPGLRIIRVREYGTNPEVARGFAAAEITEPDGTSERLGRTTGLFPITETVAYIVNPRAETMQTPLGVTKLDTDLAGNATKRGANPNPLEVVAAFTQPKDDIDSLLMYTQALRRINLHTDIDTLYPFPIHHLTKADEFI